MSMGQGATTIHQDCSLHGLNPQLDNGGGSMLSPMPSAGLLQEVTVIPHKLYYHPYRFNTLAAKSEEWNGKPRLECAHGRHPLPKTPVDVLLWTCRRERN